VRLVITSSSQQSY